MEVKRISGALGAEILGVDLGGDLADETVAAVRRAFLEHLVVFFHDQPLTPAQFMAFARRMGKPIEYPLVKGIAGFPEVIEVKKLEHERQNFGGLWHSDTAYLENPPMGSMLLAGLVAINASTKADATRTREDRMKEQGHETRQFLAEHPVVRTHPETGRKALYVNVGHTVRFKDMTEEESAPLLEFLYRHQVRPELTCRFRWRVGSLAFWDNRCTQHNPLNDYHGHRRVMHRITLAGDKPR